MNDLFKSKTDIRPCENKGQQDDNSRSQNFEIEDQMQNKSQYNAFRD